MKFRYRIVQELIVVVGTGGVPLVVAYWFGGAELLGKLFSAFMPDRVYVFYLVLLLIPFAVISWLDRSLWKRTDTQRAVWAFARSTLGELSSGIFGLWRAISGALLGMPFLWFLIEPETWQFEKSLELFAIGLLAFAECCVFSWANFYVHTNWATPSPRRALFDTSSTPLISGNKKAL
ncbi:hypothetical protein [Pseudomonas sp. YJ42]|uniref:hypothetical protein n=1 Tax=Pseudomonas sp. YJ42 TaxID=3392115 RepID=UPI0039A27769